MIDTLKLKSGYLSEGLAEAIEAKLKTRAGYDNATGNVEYEYVSGTLSGLWGVSPCVNLWRTEIVSVPRTMDPRKKDIISRECRPYVTIEGSVHKALLGHNVHGGPLEPDAASKWYVGHLGRLLGVIWPHNLEWWYQRIDWAEAFDMGSYASAEAFIYSMRNCRYPRREPTWYKLETIFWPGGTTAFKFYHKGPDFAKEDHKRIFTTMGKGFAVELQEKANTLLRVETSIKAKKLKLDFGAKLPRIGEVNREYLESLHDRETERVIQEGKSQVETVRKAVEVSDRLHENYSPPLAEALYGVWCDFSTKGEDEVKRRVSRPTFYRYKKQLRDVGISSVGTDVVRLEHSLIPAGFSLSRNSRFRLHEEAVEVTEQLEQYRVA